MPETGVHCTAKNVVSNHRRSVAWHRSFLCLLESVFFSGGIGHWALVLVFGLQLLDQTELGVLGLGPGRERLAGASRNDGVSTQLGCK